MQRYSERTPPGQEVSLNFLCNKPTNSSFSTIPRISLVQLDTLCLILTKQQPVVEAFPRFADGKNLLPEVNPSRKLSEDSTSLDTQNVSSLLLLIVIASGTSTASCHETPACARTNVQGGGLVPSHTTAWGPAAGHS